MKKIDYEVRLGIKIDSNEVDKSELVALKKELSFLTEVTTNYNVESSEDSLEVSFSSSGSAAFANSLIRIVKRFAQKTGFKITTNEEKRRVNLNFVKK